MKIHSPDSKYNILPKVYSIFPLFITLATLTVGLNDGSWFWLAFSSVFGFLFFYTFFFAKYQKYVDTDEKKIIKNFKWLWIKLREEESLSQYESVCICLGSSLPDSNWQDITVSYTYDVALIRNYTSRTTLHGGGGFENFPLKVTFSTPQEAKEYALSVSEMLEMELAVAEELTKFLKYDLLQYSKEF